MRLLDDLQTAVGTLRDGQGPEDVDRALVGLLEAIAGHLDETDAIVRAADRALELAQREFPDASDLHERIQVLRAQLGKRTALDRLSARLLAGYDALGLTPKSRGSVRAPVSGPQGRLGELRAVRNR